MSRRPKTCTRLALGLVLLWACAWPWGMAWAASEPAPAAAPERCCLRLVLLDSRQKAQDLATRAQAGQPFAALVGQLGAKAREAARLRCLNVGELALEVQAAIKDLKPGQTAPPLALGNRWAVVQLTSDEHWRRAEELEKAGKLTEAEEAWLRDAALNPDGPAWRRIASLRIKARDRQGALKAIERALAWDERNLDLLNDQATLLAALGRRDEALAVYEKALALQPADPLLLNNLAWLMTRQNKNLERAESLAGRAVQIAPGVAAFWDTLGMARQARGNMAGAAACYYQALKLDPNLPSAKANLQKCLLTLDPATLARLLQAQGAPPPSPKPQRP